MDFIVTDDSKRNVRCRIVGAPRDAGYFEQPTFFAYHKNVLYLRIGDDVYESQEAPYKGHGVAVHCRSQNPASFSVQEDSADRLSDICFSEAEYLFWPAGTMLEDHDTEPGRDSVNGEQAGSADQRAQSKKQQNELVDAFLRELDNNTA
ncbi:hypothetical protein RvY_09525 [Ramazzottius varieornatus]|uniref:Uncharacterized protein n=1 Tax=Ramazzottius varieornatus TaxID=947166 RepID=A0A1D1VBU5_RAMVA|nr:hypothetical protein RvY_09525 [Ramazzottius varieornatus]